MSDRPSDRPPSLTDRAAFLRDSPELDNLAPRDAATVLALALGAALEVAGLELDDVRAPVLTGRLSVRRARQARG